MGEGWLDGEGEGAPEVGSASVCAPRDVRIGTEGSITTLARPESAARLLERARRCSKRAFRHVVPTHRSTRGPARGQETPTPLSAAAMRVPTACSTLEVHAWIPASRRQARE